MFKKSPLAYRTQSRAPVEFPATGVFIAPVRWVLILEANPAVATPTPTLPKPVPGSTNWDWGYVNLTPSNSYDWGNVASSLTDTSLDFGMLPNV
jgi:hypothetical protein